MYSHVFGVARDWGLVLKPGARNSGHEDSLALPDYAELQTLTGELQNPDAGLVEWASGKCCLHRNTEMNEICEQDGARPKFGLGPQHNARELTDGGQQAHIDLDGKIYTLRITRAGKLILTK